MITSSISVGCRPARSMAALIAVVPRSWAGTLANDPLKLPTGVRAAEAMTTFVIPNSFLGSRFFCVAKQ